MSYNKYTINQSELDSVHNICILCWGRIGDVFFRIPLIEAVKCKYKNANIYVVVDPCAYEILENHPDIFKIMVVNRAKKPKFTYIKGLYRASKKLRHSHIDLCINLYSGGSSPFFSRIINARIRLGFDHSKALRKHNTLLAEYPGFCKHWTYCLGLMLKPIGIDVTAIRMGSSFYPAQVALDNAEKIIKKNNYYVVFNLGTGATDKNWPVKSYVKLAQLIYLEFNMIPIVLTNPDMPELAYEFIKSNQNSILLPVLSFNDLAGILIKSGILISGDTSVMHLAIAVKVPNLVLFTKTRPEIVKPGDCIHEPCFIEDKNSLNTCNTYDGTYNIPVDYAFECFKQLKMRIKNE